MKKFSVEFFNTVCMVLQHYSNTRCFQTLFLLLWNGFQLTVERDWFWFWFWFWFYYALWFASVFTLVLVLRQSSENRSISNV